MILPDTCIWVEALRNSATGRRHRPMLRASDQLIVPALVVYELRRWALRELDAVAADSIVAMLRQSQVIPLDEVTALRGAELAHAHRLASCDALIYACALQQKARLVTCDAHFKGLPDVDYQPKSAH
jgi:predicted nucleic acid-binding protein